MDLLAEFHAPAPVKNVDSVIVGMGVETRRGAGGELEVAHREVRSRVGRADQHLPRAGTRIVRSIRLDRNSFPSKSSVLALEAPYGGHAAPWPFRGSGTSDTAAAIRCLTHGRLALR